MIFRRLPPSSTSLFVCEDLFDSQAHRPWDGACVGRIGACVHLVLVEVAIAIAVHTDSLSSAGEDKGKSRSLEAARARSCSKETVSARCSITGHAHLRRSL